MTSRFISFNEHFSSIFRAIHILSAMHPTSQWLSLVCVYVYDSQFFNNIFAINKNTIIDLLSLMKILFQLFTRFVGVKLIRHVIYFTSIFMWTRHVNQFGLSVIIIFLLQLFVVCRLKLFFTIFHFESIIVVKCLFYNKE